MDELDREDYSFLTIPTSPLRLLERCINIPQSVLKHQLFNDCFANVTHWVFNAEKLPNILKSLQSNHTEESVFDSHCPALYIQSTIAHASFAVAAIIMLVHFILVVAINGDLLKLYGPCILTSICFSSMHSTLLFISAYAKSPLQKLDSNHNYTEDKPVAGFQSHCFCAGLLIHWTTLTIHLSVMFGLVEKYQHLRLIGHKLPIFRNSEPAYKRSVLTTATTIRASQNCEQQPILTSLSHYKPRRRSRFHISRKPADLTGSDTGYTIFAKYPFVRRHHCCPKECLVDWKWLGPPLSILMPLLPVMYGLYATKMYSLESVVNPVYGLIDCGGVGSCLSAFQWLLYLPVGAIFICDLVLITLISLRYKPVTGTLLFTSQYSTDMLEYESQFSMHCKMALSLSVPWITAFLSNFACLVTLWQLYAIFTGLQSLYLIVSFVFSRPFLEVIFKQNDPLVRLKLDNLVMHLPIGVSRTRECPPVINTGGTLMNVSISNKPALKVTR